MKSELYICDSFLYDKIKEAVGGEIGNRIYNTVAPEGTLYPCVIYTYVADYDIQELSSYIISKRLVYQIRVISKDIGGFSIADALIQQIDSVLHRSSRDTVDGAVSSCRRTSSLSRAEILNGSTYNIRGSFYDIVAKATALV